MKGIFVEISGLGDVPCKLLGGVTPLEAAETSAMDFFASRGEMGYFYPVKEGFSPGSEESIVSTFGNSLKESSRGQFEARGIGLALTRGDLALRVNFATINDLENGHVLDRRAGRNLTNRETEALAKAINRIELPIKFDFVPTIQHRAVLVFRGGLSDLVIGNDGIPAGGKIDDKFKIFSCRAKNDDETAHYTANILNEFLEKTFHVLNIHPINEERRKRGFMPANYLLVGGGGIDKPKLKQYGKWLSVSYTPLEMGFSKESGMSLFNFEYPPFKGFDSYEHIWEGLKRVCKFSIKTIKKQHKNFDYAYIHIKETDLPGHDNKPLEKKMMFEYIDKTLFKFLVKFAPQNKIMVAVTADHSTPCKFKSHSADPVPVLLYNFRLPREMHFNEKEARNGSLGRIEGNEFLSRIGFEK